ncbi:rRNA pseudouridine synthase [Candidatus Gracilibacteria bacterium]|nr:rRNA pseudouridine synthase [Candidatus Gracilibacteria bacterium]
MEPLRLQKYLSDCGVCSRRKAEELIVQGKIIVNGEPCTKLGTKIDPSKDKVEYQDKKIVPRQKHTYLVFNKPKGVTCTLSDIHAEETIVGYLPKIPHLYPVGRLDKDSEGIILVTTDGAFANTIMHPRYTCEKEYLVICIGDVTENDIEKMQKGIILTDEETGKEKLARIKSATITKKDTGRTYLAVILEEGQKRQIRRMFKSMHFTVQYLKRVRIGEVKLGRLEEGACRELSPREIASFKQSPSKKPGSADSSHSTSLLFSTQFHK